MSNAGISYSYALDPAEDESQGSNTAVRFPEYASTKFFLALVRENNFPSESAQNLQSDHQPNTLKDRQRSVQTALKSIQKSSMLLDVPWLSNSFTVTKLLCKFSPLHVWFNLPAR